MPSRYGTFPSGSGGGNAAPRRGHAGPANDNSAGFKKPPFRPANDNVRRSAYARGVRVYGLLALGLIAWEYIEAQNAVPEHWDVPSNFAEGAACNGVIGTWLRSGSSPCGLNQAVTRPGPTINWSTVNTVSTYTEVPIVVSGFNTYRRHRVWQRKAGAPGVGSDPITFVPEVPAVPFVPGIIEVPYISVPGLDYYPQPLRFENPAPIPYSALPYVRPSPFPFGRQYGNIPPVPAPVVPQIPDVEVPVQPDGGPVVVSRPSHRFERPRPRTRERKVRMSPAMARLWHGISAVTEVGDLIDVAVESLPDRCKPRPVKLDKPERYNQARTIEYRISKGLSLTRTHRAPSYAEKVRAVMRCWKHADLGKFVDGFWANQSEDRLWGEWGKRINEAGSNLLPDRPIGIEAGPVF